MAAAALGLALALGFSARAAVAPGVCTEPEWKAKPSASRLYAVWPREAFRRGQNGRAEIDCKVSVQGALHDCSVLSEDPPGAGFGQAALALTPQFLMKPQTCDGQPREGEIHIPIRFGGLTPTGRGASTGSRLPGGSRTDARVAIPSPQSGPLFVPHVDWVRAPTYAEVVAAYPAKAAAGRVGGHVALTCTFAGEGRLRSCATLSEVPAHEGFGAAALALEEDFLGPAKLADGRSTRDDTTTIAFTFDPAMLSDAAPIIGKPQWTRVPEAVEVAAGFPAAARAAHVDVGHVTLGCEVGEGGRLAGCAVTRASPPGLGFDQAALTLSAVFQVTVWTDEGLPTVGGRVEVPIRYEAGTPADSVHPAAPIAPARARAIDPRPVRAVMFQDFQLFTHFSAGPFYPEKAARQGVAGAAELDCAVGETGALDACVVTDEEPADMGFGVAARLMARRRAIRLKPGAAGDGPKVGERVRVSVPFLMKGPTQAPGATPLFSGSPG